MNWKLQFRSVKGRQVFWFLVVAMVPMLATISILYFERAEVLQAREFEKLQTIRDLKVRELNHWLDERLSDIAVASEDDELEGLEQILAKEKSQWTPEDLETVAVTRALMQRYVDHYDSYHELFIVGASNAIVKISTEKTREGRDKSQYPYFIEPMRRKEAYASRIYDSKTERKPAMSVSVPIRCLEHEGRHIIGVLVARIDLENSLYPLLQEYAGFGKTSETLIVNEDVVALNKLRWNDDAPLNLKITAEPAIQAASGETGVTETLDYRGETVLAAYTHIPKTGWGLVAKCDLAEANAPIRAMLKDMAILVTISAAAVLLLAWLLSRTISGPILSISETVQRVAEGDLTARYGGTSLDEIGALGKSFNKMADSLASQMAVQRGGAEISETMVVAGDVKSFASDLLKRLLDVTGSLLGAFYMRSEDGQSFSHVASLGLAAEAVPSFNAEIHEGELGRTLATRRIAFIENPPENTLFFFKTTAGVALPREIVTIPLIVDGEVVAVISLATLGKFSEDHRKVLDQAQIMMDTAFSNLLAGEQTKLVSAKLQESNEELAGLNEELQARAEELRDQADELETQRTALDEANRLKSQFLSNMSHELRTPLNSVMALSQLMLSRGPGKKPQQDTEYLQMIERSGRHLLSLINDLLDLSKIEAGRMEAIVAEFEPCKVVERSLETVRLLAEDKSLPIRVDIADMPTIFSDEEKVHQILLNLLSNAVKFTDVGEIEVTVTAANEQVLFAVRDTGVGIDPDSLDHVFNEFRQVDGSTTRKHGGTGLGLSIGRRLARLLGGDIAAESTLGEGSTFTLTLPMQCPVQAQTTTPAPVANETRPAEPSATSNPVLSPSGRPLVLVVEDNEVAAMQIRSILEESGCQVTVASDGAEALESVGQEAPDAIVLDLMMPEIDGFEVLESIRSVEQTAAVPVLVLTAKELTAEDRQRLTSNNIQQLIQKGDVERSRLKACIAKLLGQPSPVTSPSAESPEKSVAETAPPDKAQPSKTILIAEDNPGNLLVMTGALEEIGYKYVTAEDGRQAVKLARQFHPGLILMDIELPEFSGLDATKQLKADPVLSKIPIIAVTAKAMKGDREAILAAGCDDYLSKPLDPALLESTIRKWMDGGPVTE